MCRYFLVILHALILTSCTSHLWISDEFYGDLDYVEQVLVEDVDENQFIAFLVDARQLDYSGNQAFIRSVAKHPSDYSKTGDVGHAWVYLQGYFDGELAYFEGGHTGEVDSEQVPYVEGVLNGALYGYVDPSKGPGERLTFGLNSIAYLWQERHDGAYQSGSGGHWPTYVARVYLSDHEFSKLVDWLESGYDFERYSFLDHHCCHFVEQAAAQLGIRLNIDQVMIFDPEMNFAGSQVTLWEDPFYEEVMLASPDVLERSLKDEVQRGAMEEAFAWYKQHRKKPSEGTLTWLQAFPNRLMRWVSVR